MIRLGLGSLVVSALVEAGVLRGADREAEARVYEAAEVDVVPRPILQQAGERYQPAGMSRELRLRVVAEVNVRFVVNEVGAVDEVGVISARASVYSPETLQTSFLPHSIVFAEAAKRAVLRWRFEPGRKDGRPVRVRREVPIVFEVDPDTVLAGRPVIGRFEGLADTPDEYVADTPPQPLAEPQVAMPEGFSRPGGGTASVAVLVSETGEVLEIELVGSSHRVCADALIAAVKPLRFQPARRSGRPVASLWFHSHDFLPELPPKEEAARKRNSRG